MADPEYRYKESSPYTIGTDDGSPPILVEAWGYCPGFRLGQIGWVKGTGVDFMVDNRSLSPIVVDGDMPTGTPPGVYPGTQRAGWTEPELGYAPRAGTDAQFDALTAEVSHRVTHVPGTVGAVNLDAPEPSGPPPADPPRGRDDLPAGIDDVKPAPRSRRARTTG